MFKNIFFLVAISFLIPFFANNVPLYISRDKNTVIYPVIPYGENQFFEGVAPQPPSRMHLLGTDDRGRDLLVRLLYGFKNNFLFCLSLAFFITLIATIFGLSSVLAPKPIRFLCLLFMETGNCIPFYFVLLAILSILESSSAIYFYCLLFFWPPLALLVRAEARKILSSNYILSAQVSGVSKMRLAIVHILPNCFTPLKAAFPLVFSSLFSLLAFVHYLGITSFEPHASLGELLAESRSNIENMYLVLVPLFTCLIPLYMLMPSHKDRNIFKLLQVKSLSYFQWMESFFGQKDRFSGLVKLPKQMSWQRKWQ